MHVCICMAGHRGEVKYIATTIWRRKTGNTSRKEKEKEIEGRREEKKTTHRDGYDSHGLEGVMADSERPERP